MSARKVKIVHHHVFKCAGSTVMWVLEHNFPGSVLYIEGNDPGRRFSCDDVLPYLERRPYDAVSSHLLTIPHIGRNIGEIHFTVLRDPVDRVLSSYRFQKQRGDIAEDMSAQEYVETNFQADNFQAKHCSSPLPPATAGGWEINDSIYRKIEEDGLFVGLAEYFDQSMLLLEKALRNRGIPFDGAYPERINATLTEQEADRTERDSVWEVIRRKNRHDCTLYDFVKDRLQPKIETGITSRDLAKFTKRCNALRRLSRAKRTRVPQPNEWIYMEPK